MKRRVALVLGLLLLLSAVAALSAYLSRNFTGFGPVPDRYAFPRRFASTPDGDGRRSRFFYVTNRDTSPANNAFDGPGRAIGDTLSRGTFDIRIAPRMPIDPSAWLKPDFIHFKDRTPLSEADYLAQLRAAVQASPHKSLLVVVWGWKDSFRTGTRRTAYTASVLDIDTPMLLFDWPGNQGDDPLGYLASRRMAHRSGPDLGRVLAAAIRQTGAENIWVMSSSLGAQTVCDALSWMMTQPDLADADRELAHIVLSAPDVSAREFDERFAQEVDALSRNATVYVSSNDKALLLSHWINRERRLGRTPIARPADDARTAEPDETFTEAADLIALQAAAEQRTGDAKADPIAQLCIVDATPINRTRNMHHFFTDSPEFFDELYLRLLRPIDPEGRNLYRMRAEGNNGRYWILWGE